MQITKLSEHVGAEITGLDLRQPVDEATRRGLLAALDEHIAVVIRDQDFTPAQYIAAGQVFGELMEQELPDVYSLPDYPLIRQVSNRTLSRKNPGQPMKVMGNWHTDHTNHQIPPKFTMLYPALLPSSGGGTSVCSMRAGYAVLPEALKQRIAGMKTVNVLSSSVSRNPEARAIALAAKDKGTPAIHPLVRTNPGNGKKALYFHANKVENIVGMSPEASRELLDELLGYAVRPEFAFTQSWRPGDLLIWDNGSSMHKAGTDFDPNERRLLYRLIVKGERPY